MTDACPVPNSNQNLIPAAKQPCKECPFRTANADMPAPHDWFTQETFERLWAAVARENSNFPCHLFDHPENTGYDSSSKDFGLRPPVDIGERKECGGMTAMIHREVRIAAGYPDWETYIAARPTGLQRGAYKSALARIAGVGIPLTEPADPDDPNLTDPAQRVNLESMAWKLGNYGVAALLNALQGIAEDLHIPLPVCDCRFCEAHATVHQAQEVHLSTGEIIHADAALMPLLEALAAADIRTTASCQDFHGGMEQLWPEQIPVLIAQENPRTINYGVPLRRKDAVVRFENRNESARAYIRAIRSLEDLHLTDGASQAQLSFPLSMAPQLAAKAREIR